MPSSSEAVPTHAPGRTSATLPTLHQERWGRQMALHWRTAGGGPVQWRTRGASALKSEAPARAPIRNATRPLRRRARHRGGRHPAVSTARVPRSSTPAPGHAWHADAPRGQSLTTSRSLVSASSATREGSELWGSGRLCCLLCAPAMGPRGDRLAPEWPSLMSLCAEWPSLMLGAFAPVPQRARPLLSHLPSLPSCYDLHMH